MGEFACSPPWGLVAPAGHLSFYAVRSGLCHLTAENSAVSHLLRAGDFVVLTDAAEHRLRDAANGDFTPMSLEGPVSLERSIQPAGAVDQASEAEACVLVYGRAPLEPTIGNPLRRYLPGTIRLRQHEHPTLGAAGPLLEGVSHECRTAASGWEAVAEQLVQALIMQTIRCYLESHNKQRGNGEGTRRSKVLRAAADPKMGPILDAVHARPGDPWTVVGLAKRSRMSKSAFSERFREVVGQSPMQYVTTLRIQRACEMLSGTDIEVKRIATLVGYESASSFSNTFRRLLGRSPTAYREEKQGAQNTLRRECPVPPVPQCEMPNDEARMAKGQLGIS